MAQTFVQFFSGIKFKNNLSDESIYSYIIIESNLKYYQLLCGVTFGPKASDAVVFVPVLKKLSRNTSHQWVRYLFQFSSIIYSIILKFKKNRPGLQSVKREQIESNTFDMVSAGLQLSLRMSRHMTP